MKCVCGYEHITMEDANCDYSRRTIRGDESFKESSLQLTVNDKQGGWDVDRFRIETVYVCPKCGTLKVDF